MHNARHLQGARPVLVRAAIVVLVGGAMGLGTNALRKEGISLTHFEQPTMCGNEEQADAGPSLIEPSAASMLCGRPDIVIADARTAEEYAEGHIAGAVHLPCTASSASADDAIAHFGSAQTVIVYGHSTEEAQPVAATLRRRGHGAHEKSGAPSDVRVLAGGFPAWEKAGLACASGPCDSCGPSTMR
jgi:rhodanese-related sulfurtransferase